MRYNGAQVAGPWLYCAAITLGEGTFSSIWVQTASLRAQYNVPLGSSQKKQFDDREDSN